MKSFMAVGVALLAIASSSGAAAAIPAGAAQAAERKDEAPSWETAQATRRSGFTAGVLAGMSFGSVAGYPNDFSKIDNPPFRQTGFGVFLEFSNQAG